MTIYYWRILGFFSLGGWYDLGDLGSANSSGRGLAGSGVKSVTSSELLPPQNWADLIIDMRIRLMCYSLIIPLSVNQQ